MPEAGGARADAFCKPGPSGRPSPGPASARALGLLGSELTPDSRRRQAGCVCEDAPGLVCLKKKEKENEGRLSPWKPLANLQDIVSFQAKEVEETIEGLLLRLEEFCSLADMIRSDTSQILEENIPLLKAKVVVEEQDFLEVTRFPGITQLIPGSGGFSSHPQEPRLFLKLGPLGQAPGSLCSEDRKAGRACSVAEVAWTGHTKIGGNRNEVTWQKAYDQCSQQGTSEPEVSQSLAPVGQARGRLGAVAAGGRGRQPWHLLSPLPRQAFVKMVRRHVSFLEAHVLQAERDHGALSQALRKWLGSSGLPALGNKRWAPVAPTFELPVLYRTEDYFPVDVGEVMPRAPSCQRRL
ncbi:PREDICTED: breast carcinoma-amplified sequence 4 [Bison bison bison]|uniref:Breast carcinoma-amplified sequence 4 n=1 Tax=Bison bison bison TaxID=43346 RepID=A0A6P3GUU6_BISBB|nr:PREDICTED: breast carcinoma-amplified sequence 4 [Bison bison bison]